MSNARDQMPHKFSASFGAEFRSNPTEASNIFNAQPVYEVVSGYTAYTGAIYLRRIKEVSIETKGEKNSDKSKSNLIGLKYSHPRFHNEPDDCRTRRHLCIHMKILKAGKLA